MDCPFEIPVYEGNNEAGTLYISKQGLYYHLDCSLHNQTSRVLRLYLMDGFETVPVGVLMPEAESLTLHEKVSVRTFPLSKVTAAVAAWVPQPGLLPWRGEVDGILVTGWLQKEQTGFKLLLPTDEFPFVESLAEAEAMVLGELECLAVFLDDKGTLFSADSETQEETSAVEDFTEDRVIQEEDWNEGE